MEEGGRRSGSAKVWCGYEWDMGSTGHTTYAQLRKQKVTVVSALDIR